MTTSRDDERVQDVDGDPVDDLARVLGYLDAVDDGTDDGAERLANEGADGLVEVAPEILQVPWWTRRFCRAVIRAAELTGGFAPDPDDPVPGHEVSLAAISPALFSALQDDVGMRLWPQLQQVWPLAEYHGIRDAFVIRYAPGEQEDLRLHHDVAQISASVRLDDGFEGAELVFPRQGWDNARQPVGSMIAWPSLVTHPHEVRPLRSGVKHALTIWFELPGTVEAY